MKQRLSKVSKSLLILVITVLTLCSFLSSLGLQPVYLESVHPSRTLSNEEGFHNDTKMLSPSTTTRTITTSREDKRSSSNNTHVERSSPVSNNSRQGLVMDVMSIASQQRPDYWQAQQRTWASHPSIRQFWSVDERDDSRNCSQTMSQQDDVIHTIQTCRQRHAATPFLKQYRFFGRGWYLRKNNPPGWMCAQIRPGTALAKLGNEYLAMMDKNDNQDALPDYALLVDDDTLFQMNMLEEHLQKLQTTTTLSAATPIVWAGCLTVLPLGQHAIDRFSPFGGAGTVWSKEALRRLLQPIHCQQQPSHDNNTQPIHKDTTHHSDPMPTFVQQVCRRIHENLILEKDLFVEGMRMFEFIQKVFDKSPNCFHSDWLLGHFIHYYHLSEPTSQHMERAWWDAKKQGKLLPLHDRDSVGVFHKSFPEGSLCKTTQLKTPSEKSCNSNTMICHYVNPEWMDKVTKQWMGS